MFRKLMHKVFGWEYVLFQWGFDCERIRRVKEKDGQKSVNSYQDRWWPLLKGGAFPTRLSMSWKPYLCGPELQALYEGIPAIKKTVVGIDLTVDYKG